MNPNLKDAIDYIKNNSKIEMGMFTNGSMLERFDLFENNSKISYMDKNFIRLWHSKKLQQT